MADNPMDDLALDYLRVKGEAAPQADSAHRVRTEDDFIISKRYGNSLKALLERYGDELPPDRVIAQVLGLSDEMETKVIHGEEKEVSVEVEKIYDSAVAKLKKMMGEDE